MRKILQNTFLFPILLIFFINDVKGFCPPQCLCADQSIVCSCENTIGAELSLVSLGTTYVSSLTIHSCAKVSIANDSLSGVVLVDRLSLISIGRLIIEPYAFRGLLQSPRQLVIDRCSLPVLLPKSFTGLSHLDHIWFRNSSLQSVHSNAFSGVNNVGYLYFRDVKIHHLHFNAFGGMRGVKHVYIRGNVDIERAEGSLFANSSIDEIVFDEVKAKLDEGFMTGTTADSVSIANSLISLESHGDAYSFSQVRAGKLAITNVTWNIFVPALLTNFMRISVERSKIGKIKGSDTSAPINKMDLKFESTFMDSIQPYAMSKMSFNNLSFVSSLIVKLGKGALSAVDAGNIQFTDTQIRHIAVDAFADSKTGHLLFEKSTIEDIQSRTIDNSQINHFHVHRCRIDRIHRSAWSNGSIDKLFIDHSTLGKIGTQVLAGSKISEMKIRDSTIGTPLRKSLLDFHTGSSPSSAPLLLEIARSKLACELDDCQANAMLLKPSVHKLLWKFEENSCSTKEHGICASPSVESFPGLTCRSSWHIAECLCTGPSTNLLPDINATVLILGDCEEVTITGGPSTLKALYLYRIDSLILRRIPKNVKTVEIFHSGVFLKKEAIKNKKISLIVISDSSVEVVEPASIIDSQIKELQLDRSIVVPLSADTVERSSIARLTVHSSLLEDTGHLFRHIRHLNMQNSIVGTSYGMTTVESVHLRNNTLLCCCQKAQECSNDFTSEDREKQCLNYFPNYQCTVNTATNTLFGNMLCLVFTFAIFQIPHSYAMQLNIL